MRALRCVLPVVCLLAACAPQEPELSSFVISPPQARVAKGEALQLVAIATYTNGEVRDVTALAAWSVDDAWVGAMVEGRAGEVRGLAEGTTRVRAQFEGQMRTRPFEVGPAEVRALQLTPSRIVAPLGVAVPVRLDAISSDGTVEDVSGEASWELSAGGVGTLENGRFVPVARGVVTLAASARGLAISAPATVTDAAVVSVEVQPGRTSLPAGLRQAFTATALLTDGAHLDVTGTAEWTVDAPARARWSAAGVLETLAPGKLRVSARTGGQDGSATVDVTPAELQSIALVMSPASIPAGTRTVLSALGTATDGTTRDVSAEAAWSTDDLTRVVIEGREARGLRPGRAVISATIGTVTGSAELTVSDATLTGFMVEADARTMPRGTAQPLRARAGWSDGTTTDVTTTTGWVASDPAVLRVNASTGQVTALTEGVSEVHGHFGGRTATVQLTVTGAALATLEVSPARPRVAAGTTLALAVTGVWTDGATQAFAPAACGFVSLHPAVAQVSAAGRVAGLQAGVAHVTVSCQGLQRDVEVTVHDLSLQTLVVTPSAPAIAAGYARHLLATGFFADGTRQDLSDDATWATSDAAVAIVQTGLVSARAPGTATVTATVLGVSSTALVTVTPAVLQALELSPTSAHTPLGVAVDFVATGRFSDGQIVDVSAQVGWSSSAPAVATVAASGRATPQAQGSTTIVATLGGVTAQASLQVTAAVLSGLRVAPATVALPRGRAVRLVATGTWSDGSEADVTEQATWSSTDATVALVSNTAGGRGNVDGLSLGTATVRAQLGSASADVGVTVTAAVPTLLSVSPAALSLPLGARQPVVAWGLFSDGSLANVTAEALWSSSDAAVAQVGQAGAEAGEVSARALGTAQVTVAWRGLTASVPVSVTAAQLVQVDVVPGSGALPLGVSRAYRTRGTWTDGTTRDLTATTWWTSSQPGVASVSNAPASRGVVTTLALGQTLLTAEVEGRTVSVTLTVAQDALVSLEVLPGGPTTTLGYTRPFVAIGHFADGTTQVVTDTVVWTSSDTAVADFVGSPGVLSTFATGTVTLSASRNGVSAQVSHSVTP